MSFNKVMFSSASDNWKTPKLFYEALNDEFNFDFDPCPTNPKFDGLLIPWGKCNFVNPPYSRKYQKLWLKKGFEEYKKGKTVIFLIPARTDTIMWHKYCMAANEIRFIKGRLKFSNAKSGAPFPSCIVIFKANPASGKDTK